MIVSSHKKSVNIECRSRETFLAERTGVKANAVSLLYSSEYRQVIDAFNEKELRYISIWHQHEIFTRELTDVRKEGEIGELHIVTFSWRDEGGNLTDHRLNPPPCPSDHRLDYIDSTAMALETEKGK